MCYHTSVKYVSEIIVGHFQSFNFILALPFIIVVHNFIGVATKYYLAKEIQPTLNNALFQGDDLEEDSFVGEEY